MRGRKRLSRVFIDAEIHAKSDIALPQSTAHYLKNVLRLKNGDQVILFNGQVSIDFLAEIQIQGKTIRASTVSAIDKVHESPLSTILIQAIGKSEHMDYLIQKSTELGITGFIFFNSERTQNPIKASRLEKKLKHWNRITISACEQCGRNQIPAIEFVNTLKTGLEKLSASNKILLDFGGQPFTDLKSKLDPEEPFILITGAEGGLTEQEIKLAVDNGFQRCVLGPRTLRMETAAISILNIVQHRFGDLN